VLLLEHVGDLFELSLIAGEVLIVPFLVPRAYGLQGYARPHVETTGQVQGPPVEGIEPFHGLYVSPFRVVVSKFSVVPAAGHL